MKTVLAKTQPGVIKTKYDAFGVDSSLNRLELERLRAQLAVERSTWYSQWYDITEFLAPRRGRFFITDVDRGNRRGQNIINATGTHAWHTLQAGMMSGFTSPSRQWFRLTTMDPDLAKVEAVKEWLYDVTWMMSDVFLRSNLYTSLMTVYGDMSGYGTSAMMIMEDFTKVIHCYPFVIGSYYLLANDKLQINGFMRDFRLTVRQIVEQFVVIEGTNKLDWINCSSLVKSLWDAGTTEAWIDITHGIIPNPEWDPQSHRPDKKKYLSVYYERGSVSSQYTISSVDSMKVLSRRGFDKFRVVAPRWEVSGEDIYGSWCPGMEALGDIKGLQVYERRGAQALEKLINPAMVGPASLRTQKATVVPGDITYLDARDGQQKFEPAYQIKPDFQQLLVEKQAIMGRINTTFHKDLFLVVSNLDRGNVTAEEVRALQNEKLQEIGPVVDRLNTDLLDPTVDLTFDIMVQQGRIPPPPPVLRNRPIKVEYTSIIAQAMKALSAGGIEQFTGYILKIKELNPEDPAIIDKFNPDEAIERYGDAMSVPPGLVRPDDEVKKTRDARAQAQQRQAQIEQAKTASETARNLGNTPTDGENALAELKQRGAAGSLLPGGGQ